ncbi:PREDICTED: random slug protein 5 [Tarenaya hassleriana]|uniref:random slug protein 5 n=1 Tax=Tarenaya hassleriana TaxID=28532 RepID=UPI00053C6FBA|nr:PREDICTED: random slug protein 5 [Tarenaya hassleriana]
MLKETLKWRIQYKPEEIRWEEIAREAETGKIYRANCTDKYGRTVLVMRPSCQNTKSTKGQIRFLVYCMENAILNLPAHQEQMVWLIDFHGFNLSHISVKVTRETAHVLQEHYPERLGLAILYNPPKFFEPFWKMVKPFLDPKTCNKVKFVYSDDGESKKVLEDVFDMEQLEVAFGGNSYSGFDFVKYAERMKEDDARFFGNTVSTTSPLMKDANSDSESSSDMEKTNRDCSEKRITDAPANKEDRPKA